MSLTQRALQLALRKLEERRRDSNANDPFEQVEEFASSLLAQIAESATNVERVKASRAQVRAQIARQTAEISRFETAARLALADGREDAARLAIERKLVVQREFAATEAAEAEIASRAEALSEALERMKMGVQALLRRGAVLRATYQAATAQVALSETRLGITSDSANAAAALLQAGDMVDEVSARLLGLEEISQSAGSYLDELLAGLNEPAPQKQLNA